MKNYKCINCYTQSGVSLIELMVSVAIAMFLLTGLLLMFSSTAQSFKIQSELGKLQDNERMALNMLSNVIQAAGYFANPTSQTAETVLPVDTVYGFATAGQSIIGTNTGSNLDSITTRYVASALVAASPAAPASGSNPALPAIAGSFDYLMDCNGRSNTTASDFYTVNKFSVNTSNQLTCSVNGGTSLALIEGVTGMNILYGVDPDGNGSVNQYLSTTNMTAATWPTVNSIKITLLFVNPLAFESGQPATIPFTRVISLMNKP